MCASGLGRHVPYRVLRKGRLLQTLTLITVAAGKTSNPGFGLNTSMV